MRSGAGQERGVDAIRRDDDALGGDPVELDDVGLGAPGDREDAVRVANGTRKDEAERRAVLPAHQRGVSRERDVVDRDDTRRRWAQREGVLSVAEVRAESAERPGKRPRHAELLRASLELAGLDALGHELGMPGDGDEAQVGRDARQLAQQVPDVRLVARALAAEDVGVDDDEAHASSRQSASTRSPVRSQVNVASSRPKCP